MPATPIYPMWKFYPSRTQAPRWVAAVVAAFADVREMIDSRTNHGVTSDAALAMLRPGLTRLGFDVEVSKSRADKLTRPVLFGEAGASVVAYEVDGFNREHGIVLEVEAGRGAANNADYRGLDRTSLMVDAEYLVLAMMLQYSGGGNTDQELRADEGSAGRGVCKRAAEASVEGDLVGRLLILVPPVRVPSFVRPDVMALEVVAVNLLLLIPSQHPPGEPEGVEKVADLVVGLAFASMLMGSIDDLR